VCMVIKFFWSFFWFLKFVYFWPHLIKTTYNIQRIGGFNSIMFLYTFLSFKEFFSHMYFYSHIHFLWLCKNDFFLFFYCYFNGLLLDKRD
jgi:hypothetical protein